MMTKIYRHNLLSLLMVALLLVGASSCQKERFVTDTPDEEHKGVTPSYGSTYMSLNLRTGGGSALAEDKNPDHNYISDWAGADDITSFAVFVVSEDRDAVHYIGGNIEGNADVQSFTNNVLTLTPWQTSQGKKTIYAFLNPPAQYVTYLGETLSDKVRFEKRVAEPIPFQGKVGVTYAAGDEPHLSGLRPDSHIASKVLPDTNNDANKVDAVPSFLEPGTDSDLFKLLDTPLEPFVYGVKPSTIRPFWKYRDHIMSSGLHTDFTPKDKVTKEQVKNARENLVTISARRVLAQAVVSADYSILDKGLKGDRDKESMKLKGVYFQVLNFEPNFYSIAQRNDREWFNNKNTVSPSYNELAPTDFINFANFVLPQENDPFSPSTLIRDEFFRSAHFPYRSEIPNNNTLDVYKLLRQSVITNNNGNISYDGGFSNGYGNYQYDKPYSTTLWGGCYVTETTHTWGDHEDSGYRKGNTPFFAIVAAFDIASLPWSDITYGVFEQEKAEMEARYQHESAELDRQIREKEEELAPLQAALKSLQDEVAQLEQEWYALVKPGLEKQKQLKLADDIMDYRKQYKAGTLKRKRYESRISSRLQNINRRLATDPNKAEIDKKWQELDKKDLEVDANPNKEKVIKLQNKIKELKEDKAEIHNKIFGEIENELLFGKEDQFTRRLYLRGITRIYYSLEEQKFYLDYHTIPVARRGGGHSLQMSDTWLQNLIAKRLPTIKNGAPANVAVPEPTQDLLDKFSAVLNGASDNTLTPEEKRGMDFYVYGRVSSKLATFFGAKSEYDAVDLRLGYLEEYTATHRDKVVNYETLIRNRRYNDVSRGRLLMVYYAWVNPNTTNNRTWYSSPVLRNNIYHMHITGFTKMGLSRIPFVKKPNDPRLTYLHHIDPDEKVPSNDEYLPIQDPYMTVQVNNVGWGIHSYKHSF